VNGGHQTLDDSKLVVDDLGQGSQTVGGARSVRDDVVLGLVSLEVDSADEHGSVGRGGRDDDLLGTSLQVGGSLVGGGEDTGGLDDVVGTGGTPGDGSGVTLGVDVDLLTVDDELAVLERDVTLESTVGGVVLEHVDLLQTNEGRECQFSRPSHDCTRRPGTHQVVRVDEGVVDGDDIDVAVLDGVSEDDTSDSTESVPFRWIERDERDSDGRRFDKNAHKSRAEQRQYELPSPWTIPTAKGTPTKRGMKRRTYPLIPTLTAILIFDEFFGGGKLWVTSRR
jgi:hypothetical protein